MASDFRVIERNPWLGNVRELENMVEGLIALGAHGYVDVADLGDRFINPPEIHASGDSVSQGIPTLEQAEKHLIEDAISRCGGNKSKAAELLGISRTRLYRKLNGEKDVDVN